MNLAAFSRLSDRELVTETKHAAEDERHVTARLVALLAELDARKLYLDQGCSSLFAWCTRVLHLSEHAAYHRIEAARAARQHPVILDRLASGEVTLTAVGLLRPHLTADNCLALLDAARYQGKRDVERLIASLAPKPDVKPLVRRVLVQPLRTAAAQLPEKVSAIPSAPSLPASGPPRSQPSFPEAAAPDSRDRAATRAAEERYLLRLTISGDTHAKLERARDLLRHAIPSGDPAAILDRALTLLVRDLERTKVAATSRPRQDPGPLGFVKGTTRYVPAPVKRAVWARDGGRCTFVGADGRCAETGRLEFHHLTPYARGGSTDLANLTLRCHAHNAHEARLVFGARVPRSANTVVTRSGPS